jgi:mannose-6-phosphate isomerase-like protein (cupin superfamily)
MWSLVAVKPLSLGVHSALDHQGHPVFSFRTGAFSSALATGYGYREPERRPTLHHEGIYFITAGTGRMRVESETAEVKAGDAIAIPPGKKHKLWNTGTGVLSLLCCCSPCYEHSDTFITE